MNIRQYYQLRFRHDIARLIPNPRIAYFGHSWQVDCRGLENVPASDRAPFLVCLYFTVLVDQAMYAHYRTHYHEFEALTRYPKFCHGLGQFQKNPRNILLAPTEKGLVPKEEVDALLVEGMRLFVDEVVDFFSHHMPEINLGEFFERLLYDPDVQIPLIVVLANPEMKSDTGVLAYEAMKKAVQEKIKEKPTTPST